MKKLPLLISAGCIGLGIFGSLTLGADTQETERYKMIGTPRFQIIESHGTTIKMDTTTGKSWTLRKANHYGSQPTWLPIKSYEEHETNQWDEDHAAQFLLYSLKNKLSSIKKTFTQNNSHLSRSQLRVYLANTQVKELNEVLIEARQLGYKDSHVYMTYIHNKIKLLSKVKR